MIGFMCLIISRSIAATFATKWVNTKLLDYVPENKIRVRMSLMPEKMLYCETVPVL
jgi:hypothetical protein